MTTEIRDWHQKQERKERESFVVLQHVYTLSDADPTVAVAYPVIRSDLRYVEPGFGELIEHLLRVGYLSRGGGESHLWITPAGIDYIERLAWRRRSVRAPESPLTPPGQ